ncbi:MAG TPA: hypothetical protein VF720_04735, partial [Candidatus Eisenbacteria bacterium]
MSRQAVVSTVHVLVAGIAALAIANSPARGAIPVNNPANFVHPGTPAVASKSAGGPAATSTLSGAPGKTRVAPFGAKKPTHGVATAGVRTLKPLVRGGAATTLRASAPTLDAAAAHRRAELEAMNGADLKLVLDDATGTIRFLAGPRLETDPVTATPASTDPMDAAGWNARAIGFLADNATLFRLDDPAAELLPVRLESDAAGFRASRFRQAWRGREIWGTDLVVRFDPAGRVIGMSGHYRGTPKGVIPAARLDEASAA